MIDIHVHFWPDPLAPKAISTLSERSGLTPTTDGTLASTENELRLHGVTNACLMNIATKPSQVETLTDAAAKLNSGFWRSFASIHPGYENWHDEMVRISELGIKGIKLHPDYQGFYIDDDDMVKRYELADSLGLIILFHAGLDIGLPDTIHGTPKRFSNIAQVFTKGRVIMAHMGGFEMLDEVIEFLPGTSCFIDTSFSTERLTKPEFDRLYDAFGAERMLYGTDTPWGSSRITIDRINSWVESAADREKIFHGNAASLLGIR